MCTVATGSRTIYYYYSNFFWELTFSFLLLQARVGAVGREKAKMLAELEAAELAAAADQASSLYDLLT